MLAIAHLGDTTSAPLASDPLEAAAFVFNNRNSLISDADTTASLRGKSMSEEQIADGFARADAATLQTVWQVAPDPDALAFTIASIENNLRLGLAVPVIVRLLRSRRIIDARLSEPLIAESFRRVQLRRVPPPVPPNGSSPSSSGTGTSKVVLASLAIAGLAAGVGAALIVRRRRRMGLGLAGMTAQEMRGMGRAAARRIMEGLKPHSKAWNRRMKKQGLEHPLGWKLDHKRHPDLEWQPYVTGFWDEIGEMERPEGYVPMEPLTDQQIAEIRRTLMAMKAAEGALDGGHYQRRHRRAA